MLLAFVDDLRLHQVVGNLPYEKCHTAVIALDDHTNGNIRIAIEGYVVLAFRTDAAKI
jgi:hypothetical protein